MDKEAFERALKLGLGRALLHVKSHPDMLYRDVILDVCLHTTVYDGQIEGSRAVYLYEVIHSTSDYEWYQQKILAAFPASPPSEDWDYVHLFMLVHEMAAQGDQEARQKLYAKVREEAAVGLDSAHEMLDLDGVEGLVFAASLPPVERDDWVYGMIASTLIEDYPEQANEASLRAALSEYPAFLEPLLEALKDRLDPALEKRRRAARQQARRAEIPETYAEIKQLIADATDNEGSLWHTMWMWGMRASEDELRQAALDLEDVHLEDIHLEAEQTEARLLAYLNIFGRRRFPLEPDRLIAIAKNNIPSMIERQSSLRPSLHAFIAMRALTALTYISHPKVRAFALTLMNELQTMDWAVDLLKENFEDGDWALIASLTERFEASSEDIHGLGLAVRHVFERHPHIDAVPVLLHLYESSPCSHCRCSVVENLHSLGALPDWMIRECAYDSYSDTREFIEKEVLKSA